MVENLWDRKPCPVKNLGRDRAFFCTRRQKLTGQRVHSGLRFASLVSGHLSRTQRAELLSCARAHPREGVRVLELQNGLFASACASRLVPAPRTYRRAILSFSGRPFPVSVQLFQLRLGQFPGFRCFL